MQESFIKKLMANMKCGVCSQQYKAENISVLGQQEGFWFLKVFCAACNTQGLVAAVVREETREAPSDLANDEYAKFADVAPVGSDDLLGMHDFLQNFSGNVAEMLA